ncbi:hypothetical protein [Sphingobium estronivorans]|uniref:hypothetical protein n=1 Tax=Sphingobium estronivorans TaxID=1577690 RepID=UPI0012384281|nr:hypothetical protein [Sphingobium estronivorans]
MGLALGDPKRLRAAGLKAQPTTARKRIAVTLVALLPGMALALSGDASAFLLWLGACATAGWFTTIWLGNPGQSIGQRRNRRR